MGLDRKVGVPILSNVTSARAVVALSSALVLVACDEPYEEGRALGGRHVELVREDALTYERFASELEEHQEKYANEADRSEFDRGYEEAVSPVQAEIAAMVLAHASREAGSAIADSLEDLGEGLGRMFRGFHRVIKEEGKGGPRDDSVEQAPSPPSESDEESMKQVGEEVGRLIRGAVEHAESFVKGIEQELDQTDASP